MNCPKCKASFKGKYAMRDDDDRVICPNEDCRAHFWPDDPKGEKKPEGEGKA